MAAFVSPAAIVFQCVQWCDKNLGHSSKVCLEKINGLQCGDDGIHWFDHPQFSFGDFWVGIVHVEHIDKRLEERTGNGSNIASFAIMADGSIDLWAN